MNVLTMPYPPSANRLWRSVPGKGVLKSSAYRVWLAEALALLRGQPFTPCLGSFRVRIFVDRPDNRRRDLDNLGKPTMDALTQAGVIADDSHAKSILLTWTDAPAKKPGGLRIELEAA